MAGDRSFISTPGRLQIALAASYITISDLCRRELSKNYAMDAAVVTTKRVPIRAENSELLSFCQDGTLSTPKVKYTSNSCSGM